MMNGNFLKGNKAGEEAARIKRVFISRLYGKIIADILIVVRSFYDN